MKLYESGENYLENILILKRRIGTVRSVDLAREMNFSKPSVSRAVHLLEDGGYLNMADDGLIELTEKGKEVAEKIYERHVFLTCLLRSIGVDKDMAVLDACRIEHVISSESFDKIKERFSALAGEVQFENSEKELFNAIRKILNE